MVVIVALAALAGVFVLLWGFVYSPSDEIRLPDTGRSFVNRGDAASPARVIIPSIGVDARIQHVGIGKSGNMAVPARYADAGWYKYGARPGETGSAVLAGHVDNGFGLPGVFKRLEELRSGDEIFVETEKGERIRYEVLKSETYPYDEAPLKDILNRSGGSFLNLITCKGEWLSDQEMYGERLVVYAELEYSQ